MAESKAAKLWRTKNKAVLAANKRRWYKKNKARIRDIRNLQNRILNSRNKAKIAFQRRIIRHGDVMLANAYESLYDLRQEVSYEKKRRG